MPVSPPGALTAAAWRRYSGEVMGSIHVVVVWCRQTFGVDTDGVRISRSVVSGRAGGGVRAVIRVDE